MKELSLPFEYTARYYKLGEITKDTKHVWFVIHGYGQLAQFFIKKFNSIEKKGVCVIAPEGLSRFYLEDIPTRMAGGNNRVGASWMTRENREMDIENYINYLQSVYAAELKSTENIKVTLLGFSQGAATATRWAISGKPFFDRFVLWAGIFPADMNFSVGQDILGKKKIISVYGDKDPFITPDRIQEMTNLCEKLKVKPKQVVFDGQHEINDQALNSLYEL